MGSHAGPSYVCLNPNRCRWGSFITLIPNFFMSHRVLQGLINNTLQWHSSAQATARPCRSWQLSHSQAQSTCGSCTWQAEKAGPGGPPQLLEALLSETGHVNLPSPSFCKQDLEFGHVILLSVPREARQPNPSLPISGRAVTAFTWGA